jgi:choline dehydrogenase-like flavoprotein
VGVEAVTAGGRTLRVRARVVVLAAGAVPTPLFLLDQGICNTSGQVGRNLSIHPGTSVSALFEQRVAGYNHIMQGYACDQFHRDGILLLGAQPSIEIGAMMLAFNGRRYTEVMERFDHLGSFGAMIEDASQNGRVRAGPRGWPIITYNLQPRDVDRLHQGLIHVMEIFQAAGADRFFPVMRRPGVVEGARGLDAFRRLRPRPWDFVCTSFHPLGTCRMGPDPFSCVVGVDHQAHDLAGLFLVDGSTVPGPTAVNPQLTILAMAVRAAEKIAAHLE